MISQLTSFDIATRDNIRVLWYDIPTYVLWYRNSGQYSRPLIWYPNLRPFMSQLGTIFASFDMISQLTSFDIATRDNIRVLWYDIPTYVLWYRNSGQYSCVLWCDIPTYVLRYRNSGQYSRPLIWYPNLRPLMSQLGTIFASFDMIFQLTSFDIATRDNIRVLWYDIPTYVLWYRNSGQYSRLLKWYPNLQPLYRNWGQYSSPLIFIYRNIDCGYSLEPPRRGGSNEYPQSMFWAEIWKISEFLYLKIFSFLRWNFLYIWIGVFS